MKTRQPTYRPCRDYSEEKIARLLEKPLTDPDRSGWEIHARNCPICRDTIAADRQLIADIERIPDTAPVRIRATVMARVSGRKRSRLFGFGDLAWGASAAFAGVILGLALVWNGDTSRQAGALSDTGHQMASLTVEDDFDTFAADLAHAQGE